LSSDCSSAQISIKEHSKTNNITIPLKVKLPPTGRGFPAILSTLTKRGFHVRIPVKIAGLTAPVDCHLKQIVLAEHARIIAFSLCPELYPQTLPDESI
jgi:hypothetical protein